MRALLTVILLALVAAPAAAQTEATMAVTVTPPASLAFVAGTSAEGPVSVSVTMQGVYCSQDTTIDVALTVPSDNLTSTMTAAVAPTTVTINVTAGEYTVNQFSGSGNAVLNVSATNDTAAADYDVAVVGTVAGVPTGCAVVGTAGPSNVEGSGTAVVTVQAAPEPEPTPEPEPEEKGLPGPSFALVAGALAAVALAFRRRG